MNRDSYYNLVTRKAQKVLRVTINGHLTAIVITQDHTDFAGQNLALRQNRVSLTLSADSYRWVLWFRMALELVL